VGELHDGAAVTRVNLEQAREIEQFLYYEARLLDERRWSEWLNLFTPDGIYWVPLARGQTDPINHASLFYENATLREVRARRLEQSRAFSQQPQSWCAHLVGNVTVEAFDATTAEYAVRSTFHLLEWRKTEQRALAGSYQHRLKRERDAFKIQLKRVDLINCDAVYEALQVFI
jgi:3-phenylpropionate/cinnamic acid dioxygenase small subunit